MLISFKIFHALMLIYNNGINIIVFESPLMATLLYKNTKPIDKCP